MNAVISCFLFLMILFKRFTGGDKEHTVLCYGNDLKPILKTDEGEWGSCMFNSNLIDLIDLDVLMNQEIKVNCHETLICMAACLGDRCLTKRHGDHLHSLKFFWLTCYITSLSLSFGFFVYLFVKQLYYYKLNMAELQTKRIARRKLAWAEMVPFSDSNESYGDSIDLEALMAGFIHDN